ncbi:MAG: hypothetical protein NTZ16_02705 [Verrucomicrobia bacterium]|nr:hypothetical protein [Verrucomicrobiota bacterium]
MFKRLGHLLLIVALLAATGGHWAVLQSVAWTTMLAANLTTDSFGEAVSKTFDGEHPCGLCCAVKAGKATEKKTDLPAPLKKFEYVNEAPRIVFAAPTAFTLLAARVQFPDFLSAAPPLPPPRGLLG